jgi:hypothetical protein
VARPQSEFNQVSSLQQSLPPPPFSYICGSDGGALHAAAVQVDIGLESLQVIGQQQAHQVICRDRGNRLVDRQALRVTHGDLSAGQAGLFLRLFFFVFILPDQLCWLLAHPLGIEQPKRIFMLFTFNNFQEQHDGQNPSLVTSAHQIMDKTRHIGVFLGKGVQIIISNFCYYDTASVK